MTILGTAKGVRNLAQKLFLFFKKPMIEQYYLINLQLTFS